MSTNSKWKSYAVFIFAAMGGVLYGYDLGIISGALLLIKPHCFCKLAEIYFVVYMFKYIFPVCQS